MLSHDLETGHQVDIVVKKSELIRELRHHLLHGELRWKGERYLLDYIAEYLSADTVREEEYGNFLHSLPFYLQRACEDLREQSTELAKRYHPHYCGEVGRDNFPNLTDPSYAGHDRGITIGVIAHALAMVAREPWLKQKIEDYFFAKDHVLIQSFRSFQRDVWHQGMRQMIDDCKFKGMSGEFGKTALRSYVMAGRIMFTFARRRKGKTTYRGPAGSKDLVFDYIEESITFIGDDSDKEGRRSGIQSVQADFRQALEMIEEVTETWKKFDKKGREQAFKVDKGVGVG